MMQRPTLEQYTDAEGYADYYGFDMAMDQWRWQFPDLTECWCPETPAKAPAQELEVSPSLEALLEALLA